MELALIRHGESTANREGIIQGRGDYPLSESGREQALLTSQALTSFRPYRIFTSPLARARETAEIINRPHNVEVVPLPELMEFDLGEFEGLTFPRILELHPEVLPGLKSGIPFHHLAPGAETDESVNARARRAMEQILDSGLPRVVVVSHLGVLERVIAAALKLPPEQLPRENLPLRNCSITRLKIDFREAVMDCMNETLHLDR